METRTHKYFHRNMGEAELTIPVGVEPPESYEFAIQGVNPQAKIIYVFQLIRHNEYPQKREDCKAHGKPIYFYGLIDPDSDGHCFTCHCICNPDGPVCGHTAGCPGC